VLFADIVGSTELIAGLDAEDAMKRLRPVVTVMAQEVRRFEGTILRTLGDGIMAVFGAPRAQEGHAVLACQAALAMMDAVNALPSTPKIRVGIDSGEVVAGGLDTRSGLAVEQDAQGLTVHLASRIEQLAEPGGICISRACRALIAAYCETVLLGPHTLKGISETVDVYRLTGLRPSVASDQFRGSDLVPLRGRAEELGGLREALRAAEQGIPSVIGLSAPAGVGKSRLCFEFSEWCRKRGVGVFEARGHVFGHATPLRGALEMLRTFLRISPSDLPAVAQERVRRRLLVLDSAFEADVPLVCEFLGIPLPEKESPQVDPQARHTRLLDIFRRLVNVSGRRTSVIIVEDMHWLDEASCEFVNAMVEGMAGTHTLMVVNFRPSWTAGWMSNPNYHEVRLRELDGVEIRRVVRDLLGDDPTLPEIIAQVAEQSGGNPFFAEELTHSLAQNGVLLGERGQYRLAATGAQNATLPATVEAVIGARLDHLSEPEKAVLQVGSVIGKEFSLELVRAVTGLDESELQKLMDRRGEAELVQTRMSSVGPVIVFRHPLIQEVAYAMQLRTRRSRIHAAVARAIEDFSWGQLEESASLLAHHYEAAGQPLIAAKHLERAALWIGRTNSSQALSYWKKLRLLLRDQPRSEVSDRQRALASVQILNFGWREGMTATEAQPYAEEALRDVRERGDRRNEPLLLLAYGRVVAATRSFDDATALIREALTLAEANGDRGGVILYSGVLSQIYTLAGLLGEALTANDAAMAAIAEESEPHGGVVIGLNATQFVGFDVEHWIGCQRTRILLLLGRFDEATSSLARVSQVKPERITPIIQYIPHAAAAELAWHRGDGTAARWHAARVAGYADQAAMPYLLVIATGYRGMAALTAGDYSESIRCFREALDTARRRGAGLEYEAKHLALLADAFDCAGEQVHAADTAGEAIEAARRRADRIWECFACIILARTLIAGGERKRLADAIIHLDRAESLLRTTGVEFFRPVMQAVKTRLTVSGWDAAGSAILPNQP
jgi:adenylate cyclase